MLKQVTATVVGMAMALGATTALASPVVATINFDFSPSLHFTATLAGELHDQGTVSASDDFIDGITQLTAQANGVDLRGPLYLGAYDSTGRRDDLAARLYLVIGPNAGFIIANCDSTATCTSASAAGNYNYFFARTPNSPEVQFYDAAPGHSTVSAGGALRSLNISVAPANAVPEPESLSLLGAALAAAALFGRRKSATNEAIKLGRR